MSALELDAVTPALVVPAAPPPSAEAATKTSSASLADPVNKKTRQIDGFFAVFGWMGIPMVLAFLSSSVVVFFQAYLQLHPTKVANHIMNTTQYDGGEFWMLTEHPSGITATTATVLILIGIGYFALVVFVLFFRSRVIPRKKVVQPARKRPSITEEDRQVPKVLLKNPWLAELHRRFSGTIDMAVQYKNAVVDLPKLSFQTVTLINYLRDGFAAPLIIFYASLLGINWIISFLRFRQREADDRMVITRLCYLFDLFFAVFAPMVVLAYSCSVFNFDRETFRTYEEKAQPAAFERIARMFADPLEVARFRAGFNNLRLAAPFNIVIKCLLNLLALYKWKTICTMLILQHHHTSTKATTVKMPRTKEQEQQEQRQRRRLTIFGVVVFLLFGGFVMIYTIVSYTSTTALCESHKDQCPVISYQWSVGSEDCPCLVFIDRNTVPKTYAEWLSPKNVTNDLAAMSRAGTLTIIQIINRQVYPLPEEMRRNKDLEQFIFMYTKTDRLPDWMKEFRSLHYFHFEGDFSMAGLSYAPHDMFSTMSGIRYIHTGGVQGLKHYPSLKGLKKLTYLVIAIAHSLEELPDVSDLENLESFLVVEAYRAPKLPRIAHLTKLKSFTVGFRNELCCDGYLDGQCDLTNYSCLARDGEKPPACATERMPADDWARVNNTPVVSLCPPVNFDLNWFKPTKESTDDLCGGVMYKQCQMGPMTGICINGRYQVINCDASGNYDPARRLQIERGVGDKCDPVVEAWLGCKPT